MSRGSVLPEGMTLAGEIRGQGDLIVAGSIEGPIAIDGHLTIEPSGSVRGEVKARAMVLRGTLVGHAIADETIRLEPGARMVGDARAERVSVVEGAMLRGRITMTGAQASRRSSAGQVGAPEGPRQMGAPEGPRQMGAPEGPRRVEAPRQALAAEAPRQALAAEAPRQALAAEAPRPAHAERPRQAEPRPRQAPEPRQESPRHVPEVPRRAIARDVPLPAPPTRVAGEGRTRPRNDTPPASVAPNDPRSGGIAGAARIAPPAPSGVLVAPRERAPDDELDARPTGRFVRRADSAVPVPEALEGSRVRPDRRPPEPVIPGVGRQRARRKDGGASP